MLRLVGSELARGWAAIWSQTQAGGRQARRAISARGHPISAACYWL